MPTHGAGKTDCPNGLQALRHHLSACEHAQAGAGGDCNCGREGSNNRNKTRQVANKQLVAIEALPGAILREVFDFTEGEGD